MLLLKFLLLVIGFGFLVCAIGLVFHDVYLALELDRILGRRERQFDAEQSDMSPVSAPRAALPRLRPRRAIRSNTAAKLTVVASLSLLAGWSILVVPAGEAGRRTACSSARRASRPGRAGGGWRQGRFRRCAGPRDARRGGRGEAGGSTAPSGRRPRAPATAGSQMNRRGSVGLRRIPVSACSIASSGRPA